MKVTELSARAHTHVLMVVLDPEERQEGVNLFETVPS